MHKWGVAAVEVAAAPSVAEEDADSAAVEGEASEEEAAAAEAVGEAEAASEVRLAAARPAVLAAQAGRVVWAVLLAALVFFGCRYSCPAGAMAGAVGRYTQAAVAAAAFRECSVRCLC